MTRRKRVAPVAALLAIAMVLAFASCSRPGPGEYKNAPDSAFGERYDAGDTWAVYWYICGGELETGQKKADGSGYEKGGKATNDLAELLEVELPGNVTVVIEMGGTKIWQTPDIAADANSRYVYDSEGLRLVEERPRAAMNDEKTLEDFLRFCNENYPADHRGVIFWDHGGGSVKGVIFDEYSGRSLKLPQLREAFEAVCTPSEKAPPYEFIGFDACLMATVDVAGTLNGLSRWMVASEEFEPGCGWNYRFFDAFADGQGMNGGHLGKRACDAFYADCVKHGIEADVTMALIDLAHIDGLLAAYEKTGAELYSKVCRDPANFGLLERAALKTENYGGNNEWDGYVNMADLGDLTRKAEAAGLLSESPAGVYAALDACVVYQVKGRLMSGANGLSCYYSYSGDRSEFDRFAALKGDHPFRWLYHYRLYHEMPEAGLAYMKSVAAKHGFAVQDAPPLEALDGLLDGAQVRMSTAGGREVAELGIGGDTAAKLASVRVELMRLGVDGAGTTVFGTEHLVHDNWENGVYYDSFNGQWPALDGAYIYLEARDGAGRDALYNVPILLNGERCTLVVGYAAETGDYEILGTRQAPNGTGMGSKDQRRLAPGDVIQPLRLSADSEGARAWAPSGTVAYTADTRIEDRRLPGGMYYLAFTMTDIKGNTFTANAVKTVVGGADSQAAGPVTLDMGTAGVEGMYYPYGHAIAETLMRHIGGLTVNVLPTNASQANIYAIAGGELDMAIAQNDVMAYAEKGVSLFYEAVDGFSAVAGLYPDVCQIVARPGVASVADLKGKDVSIGEIGYGTSFDTVQILEAYGLTVMDVKAHNLDFGASVSAFLDGRIDAFVCVAGAPAAIIAELAEQADIVLLGVDDEHADKLIERYPFYTRFTIDGGAYRGVGRAVQTVAVKAALIVSDDLSENLVYGITKGLFTYKDEIAKAHAMGAFLDPAFAIEGITVPFHPGAAKYYREIGAMR